VSSSLAQGRSSSVFARRHGHMRAGGAVRGRAPRSRLRCAAPRRARSRPRGSGGGPAALIPREDRRSDPVLLRSATLLSRDRRSAGVQGPDAPHRCLRDDVGALPASSDRRRRESVACAHAGGADGRAGFIDLRARGRRGGASAAPVAGHGREAGRRPDVPPGEHRAAAAGSRAAIERAFGLVVESFCYPYGRVDASVRAAVRAAGFRTATTTRQGLASPLADPLMLRRIRVDGRKPADDVLRALRRAAIPTVGPMTAGDRVL
jgi:Polysaccharide deacetylase